MRRAVVNVATGHYVRGQQRLRESIAGQAAFISWADVMPPGSPSHYDVPYAFKAWAIQNAANRGATTILWADASILPIQPLGSLFELIERDGYWISRNGWRNDEWTADEAYPMLFPHLDLESARQKNAGIPHVVATAFGLDLSQWIGRAIFERYLRHAQDGSFRGPWKNGQDSGRTAPCGPPSTLGHRHDQTALSVIAAEFGCELTDPPNIFAYRGGEIDTTILVADSRY